MNESINLTSKIIKFLLKYLKNRLNLFKKYLNGILFILFVGGFLFYDQSSKNGLKETIISSEVYFLFLGIIIVNIFTYPIFEKINNSVNYKFNIKGFTFFDNLEKKMPSSIILSFNTLYILIYFVLIIPLILFFQFSMLTFIPAIIWSYLYVHLLE